MRKIIENQSYPVLKAFVFFFGLMTVFGCGDLVDYKTVEKAPSPLESKTHPIPAYLDVQVGRYISIKYELEVPYQIVVLIRDEMRREILDAQYTVEGFPEDAVRNEGDGYWSMHEEGLVTFRACTVDLNKDNERICSETTVIVDSNLPELRVQSPEPGDQLSVQSYMGQDGRVVPGVRELVVRGEVFDGRAKPNVSVNGYPAIVADEPDAEGWYDFEVVLANAKYGINHLVVEASEVPLINSDVTKVEFDVLWVPSYLRGESRTVGDTDELIFDLDDAVIVKFSQNFFDDKQRVAFEESDAMVNEDQPSAGQFGEELFGGAGGDAVDDEPMGGSVETDPLFFCVDSQNGGSVDEPQEGNAGDDGSFIELNDARKGTGQVFATDLMDILNWLVDEVDIDLLIEDLVENFTSDLVDNRHPRMPIGQVLPEEDESLVYEYFYGQNGPPDDSDGNAAEQPGLDDEDGDPEGVLIKLFITEIQFPKPRFEFDIVGRNSANNLGAESGVAVGVDLGDIHISGRVAIEGIGDNIVLPEGLPGDISLPWDLATTLTIPGVGATAYLEVPEVDARGQDVNFRFNQEGLVIDLPDELISADADSPILNTLLETAYENFGLKSMLQSLIKEYSVSLLEDNLDGLFGGEFNQAFSAALSYESCTIQTSFHGGNRFKAFVDGGLGSLKLSHQTHLLTSWYARFGTSSTDRLDWGEGIPMFSPQSRDGNVRREAVPAAIANGEGTIQAAIRTELLNGLVYAAWSSGLLNISVGDNVIPSEYLDLVEGADLRALLPPLFRLPRIGEFADHRNEDVGRDIDLVLSIGQLEVGIQQPNMEAPTWIGFGLDIGMWVSLESNVLNFGVTNKLNVKSWDLANENALINAELVGSLLENLVWPQVVSMINEISRFELPLPSITLKPLIEEYDEIERYAPGLVDREFWLEVNLPRGLVIPDSFDYIVFDILPSMRTLRVTSEE